MDTELLKKQTRSKFTIKAFLWRNYFWFFCLAGILSLATIRSPPVYGKIDFFLLDGRPWWPEWKALVTETRTKGKTPVYTDLVTGYYILGCVFGEVPLVDTFLNKKGIIYIEDMENLKKNFKCIINLVGYTSSWVPEETGHWSSKVGKTSEFYKFRTRHKESDIRVMLKKFPLQRCVVYDQEKTEKESMIRP